MNRTEKIERNEQIAKDFKGCVEPDELTKKYGLSYQRILQIVGQESAVKSFNSFEESLVQEYRNLDLTKKSLEALYQKYGKSKVYYVLAKHKIQPGKDYTEKRNRQIAEDFRMGLPPADIAIQHGVQRSYVYRILGKFGLKSMPSTAEIVERNALIRRQYATKEYTQETLANLHNLSRGCIGLILTYAYPYNDAQS